MKLKDYFKKAKTQKWAIGQFNFSTLEQLRGIFEAAKVKNSPIILGTSEGESGFLGREEIVALVRILKKKYGIPAFLNLDHGKDLKVVKEAIDLGYDAVHYDGSKLPFEENIKQTREAVKYGRRRGVFVEGEVGSIRGESDFHHGKAEIRKEDLASPEVVERYVRETSVDSIAVAIGNIHGVYSKQPHLDIERLKNINKVAKKFLVLHGGSGIPEDEIKAAVASGITKINFNTEIRIVWRCVLEKTLRESEEIKPYKILAMVQPAIQKKIEEKIILIGSQNKIK